MDVTTALGKPEDGDFSGGAPGFFCLYGIRRIALVDFDLFFRSIMSGNDFPKLAVELGRCIAIDADDLRSTAHGRACNEILQKAFLGRQVPTGCGDVLSYDISSLYWLAYANPIY